VRPTTPPELRQALGVGEKGQREEFARKILQDVMAEESRRSSRSSRREDVQRSESAMSYYGVDDACILEATDGQRQAMSKACRWSRCI